MRKMADLSKFKIPLTTTLHIKKRLVNTNQRVVMLEETTNNANIITTTITTNTNEPILTQYEAERNARIQKKHRTHEIVRHRRREEKSDDDGIEEQKRRDIIVIIQKASQKTL
jgi:DNA-binding GntR family transcriptional regulator